jgi:hypothetical protein
MGDPSKPMPTEAEREAFTAEMAARRARMKPMPAGPERDRLLAMIANVNRDGPRYTSEEVLAALEARRPHAAE